MHENNINGRIAREELKENIPVWMEKAPKSVICGKQVLRLAMDCK